MNTSFILLQTQTTVALEDFSGFVIMAVNIIFIIILALGLINTVRKFIMSDPSAMSSLGQLVVGVIVFLVFNIFKDDLTGIFGEFQL
ncbi:hypothetical protein [Cesiribacter andamanensis]|uniref:Uncharacterized protein n=1 Tax=Cesiribacter andamanensis AMV16 TaxID=1279009 RepID=M7MVZ4_9BACT|nr:hypothetical protein [Cesiribacter andamanensis]EMR00618.1 hypothetical protein ADICEAN_04266 [Cesiribacter andamanensis AMV16]